MWFKIIGEIDGIETIAQGRYLRELGRLKKFYGKGRWRKLKGSAWIQLPHGDVSRAEIHWYEAHGVGQKEFKIKRFIEGKQP